jgi:hypothetical protein
MMKPKLANLFPWSLLLWRTLRELLWSLLPFAVDADLVLLYRDTGQENVLVCSSVERDRFYKAYKISTLSIPLKRGLQRQRDSKGCSRSNFALDGNLTPV